MSIRQTLAAVGVAVAIAGLGGAAIYAATDSPGMGGHGGPPGGPPPMAAARHDDGDPATVHSEAVLADGSGGYTTSLTQTGTITALSTASITVRSADGFSQTYVLPAAAAPPFAVADQVLVRATRTGTTATVTSIGEPLERG
ncbi:hypothetical protein AFM11_34945 [Mycolicibacterium wolinskyi]|uniref:DUF5666 domain-containing protein n=1 Tax=Mycolicibacterium wolinskyi TaxID=59750 RepID=A0A132PBB6_9MYCO|nr:hypothetical protein [Mycolicibacterium wolinskyi]KWX19594.1 hypothetical protein AFM11_34945 [Mycolicibacterium wolinskyi]